MKNEDAYKLEKAKSCCCACGAGFAAGDIYISAIRTEADGLFKRKDFCRSCWAVTKNTFFSFWQSRHNCAGDEKAEELNAFFSLYRSLGSREDRQALELKYVLALYLSRKKTLRLTDIRNDGAREILVFEGPEDGEKTLIADPGLSDERTAELTDTIRALFPDEEQ